MRDLRQMQRLGAAAFREAADFFGGFFFPKAAAEVASTPVPTHPPTPQKDRWRVEEERLKYREGEEGNEGSGCGR